MLFPTFYNPNSRPILKGFSLWTAGTTFLSGDITQGSDGNYYQAVATTTGNNPTTDEGTYWFLYWVNASTTLSVASGGRFTTVGRAYRFCKRAIIPDPFQVTISVAAGTFVETNLNLDSPFGSHIKIVGAGSASTTLDYSAEAGDGIFAGAAPSYADGMPGAYISALTVKGSWNYAGGGGAGASGYQKSGIAAVGGSSIHIGSDVKVDSFYYSLKASDRGLILVDSALTTTGAGDVSIFAFRGGCVVCQGAVTVSNVADAGSSLGAGLMAENGGNISVAGTYTFSGCRNYGGSALSNGNVTFEGDVTAGTSTTAGTVGLYAGGGGSVTGYSTGTWTLSSIGSSSSGNGILVDRNGKIQNVGGNVVCSTAASHCVLVWKGGEFMVGGNLTASSSVAGSGVFVKGGRVYIAGNLTASSNASAGLNIQDNADLVVDGTSTTNSNAASAGIFARNGARVSLRGGATSSTNTGYGAQHNGPMGYIDVTSWTATGNTVAATNVTANAVNATTGVFIKTT